MTARAIFDIYDLSSPFITPTAPQAAPTATIAAARQGRPYMQRLADSRLFNGSVILAVFSSAVYSIGTVLDMFPLGRVTGAQNMPLWFGTIAGGLSLAGVITALLAAAVLRVRV